MEIDNKIIERLKKIMKLKEGASTIGEAEAAAGAAQRLIAQYNLDISQIDLSEKEDEKAGIEEERMSYRDKRTGGQWRLDLMYAIADNNFCSALFWHRKKEMIVIGTRNNIDLVTFLYNNLAERLFLLAKEEYKKYKEDKLDLRYMVTNLTEKEVSYDAFYRRFLNGAVLGIRIKLQEGMKKLEQENNNLTGLIVYNDQAILDYKKEKYNPKNRNREAKIDDIYIAGYEKGKKMELHAAIGQTKPNATHTKQLRG